MIYVEEEGRWAINSVPSDDTLSKFCGEILPASFAWIGRASTLKRVYCPRKLPYLLSSPQFRLSLQKNQISSLDTFWTFHLGLLFYPNTFHNTTPLLRFIMRKSTTKSASPSAPRKTSSMAKGLPDRSKQAPTDPPQEHFEPPQAYRSPLGESQIISRAPALANRSAGIAETNLTGMGNVSRRPDCGVIVFEIAHRGFKEKCATPEALEKTRSNVLAKAKSTADVLSNWRRESYDDEQITHFSISPLGVSTRVQSEQRVFEAKTMVKVTFAKCIDFEALRHFAANAIELDGVTITNIDWRLNDDSRELVHQDARKQAIYNARQIAFQHARELYKLDIKREDIKPWWSDERPYYTYTAIDCGRPAASPEGKVVYFAPEDIQVTVNVSCRFRFDLDNTPTAAAAPSDEEPLMVHGIITGHEINGYDDDADHGDNENDSTRRIRSFERH